MSELKVFRGTVHPQTLPKSLHVLSEDELKKLTLYKHSSDKTTFEKFWCDTFATFVDTYFIPDIFTPNVVTLLG